MSGKRVLYFTSSEHYVYRWSRRALELDARFPGIEAQLMGKVAVAIDGDIVHDPLLEAIEPDSEVYFLHRIEGG